jgi:hypothetical protein
MCYYPNHDEIWYLLREDGELELDTEPMTDYDWEEWLANDDRF